MSLLKRWLRPPSKNPDPRALDAWELLQEARQSRPKTEKSVARIRREVSEINGLEALFDRAFGGQK